MLGGRCQISGFTVLLLNTVLACYGGLWLRMVDGQSVCGVRQTKNESVVDGEQIGPGEWPWHVGVYWWKGSKLNPPDRVCEGALVDREGWVLTAANCLKSVGGDLLDMKGMIVHVGLVALQQNTEKSRRFHVENVVLNDELDLALIRLKVYDEWEGMPICMTDGVENFDKIYGKSVYVLQQSHRHRLGGFEIVKLQLEREVVCYGSTLAVKARSVSDSNIRLKTKDTKYHSTGRGTPLYVKSPGGWTLLGISNKIQTSIPGTLCQPGDYESFLNVNLAPVSVWFSNERDNDGIESVETSTE
ncbi:uncharacterized protein LOC5579889 [Aedes aegypti]|uniref:Uncharacterized protein n=1 Tax=Aedes aegypti TaxID=7159 RepID=A0A1S4EXK9_AEDAE|nr:uncharacterized protein LOC5579889 [Aedes aegypti]